MDRVSLNRHSSIRVQIKSMYQLFIMMLSLFRFSAYAETCSGSTVQHPWKSLPNDIDRRLVNKRLALSPSGDSFRFSNGATGKVNYHIHEDSDYSTEAYHIVLTTTVRPVTLTWYQKVNGVPDDQLLPDWSFTVPAGSSQCIETSRREVDDDTLYFFMMSTVVH